MRHPQRGKRSSNPGVGAGFRGKTGSRFIIIARNGEKVDGATLGDWRVELNKIAETLDWKGADLFPRFFDMPALGT